MKPLKLISYHFFINRTQVINEDLDTVTAKPQEYRHYHTSRHCERGNERSSLKTQTQCTRIRRLLLNFRCATVYRNDAPRMSPLQNLRKMSSLRARHERSSLENRLPTMLNTEIASKLPLRFSLSQ